MIRASLAFLLLVGTAQATELASRPATPLVFGEYLQRVMAANPDLRAARAGVDVADAQIKVAKVFPDPELTLGVNQYDVTHRGNPTMAGAQINVPIELGGKRRARVAVARSGLAAATADYHDATRTIRALAADAFVDALHAAQVVDQKQGVLDDVERLAAVNQRRLAAGDISEVELLQSRVEAQRFRAEVLAAKGDQRTAEVAMAQLLGPEMEATFRAAGDLTSRPPALDSAGLLAAVDQRADVRAATTRVQQAERQIESEKAKRVIDISLGAGWQHSLRAGDQQAADLMSASVSVPLPFSHVYKGELEAARSAHRQTQSQLQATRARAQGELRQALARFEAAAQRVAIYDQGTLSDAKSVLDKILYSYEHGDATLIEVLIAQRTASDVQLAYLDALAERAHALVAVAQAAGLDEELIKL